MEYVSRAGPVESGIMPPGAGGIIGFEDFGGISGGADYAKAYNTSILARFAPDTLATSMRRSFDDPWDSAITPAKPNAVSMVGADVFGPDSFHFTTRNNIVGDIRGEAAFGSISGEPPVGASEVSWASFSWPSDPSSQTTTCGTCAPRFSRPNPVSQPPAVGSYGNPAAANSGRRDTVWSKVKSAYYL